MHERTGEAFEFDEQLTVVGRKLEVGEQAPDFTLDHFDGNAMQSVRLADSAGRVRLLNVINSLDTPVCHIETRKWDQHRIDLPFAQSRWQSSEGVTHQPLSAHKNESFGSDYGVLLKEWRLLQRAVFVISPDGSISYVEYVPDQMREPNYEAAVEAVQKASRS
jgi:thiol peroxidase